MSWLKRRLDIWKKTINASEIKKDDYAFSALCVKADYYTNPAITFMDVFKEYEQ